MENKKKLFFGEFFRNKTWKKPAVIITGILLVVFTTFGIASAKYGLNNISSLVLHGHFEQNHSIQSENSEVINTVDNSTISPSSTGETNLHSSTSTTGSPKTYTNSKGETVESPDSNPVGATARCNDGTYSHSLNSQGTCSSHGGVARVTPKCDQVVIDNYEQQKVSIRNRYTALNQSVQQQWDSEIDRLEAEKDKDIQDELSRMGSAGIMPSPGTPEYTVIQAIISRYESTIQNDRQNCSSQINANNNDMNMELSKIDQQSAAYKATCQQ